MLLLTMFGYLASSVSTRAKLCRNVCVRVNFELSTVQLVTPKNNKQKKYVDILNTPKPYIVVATGSAGTGKTLFATHVGVQQLKNKTIDKIVITRPAVCVDENHGFLPGTLEKKMEPWTRPIFDILLYHFPRNKIDTMIRNQVIEICPLAYMRGRTFTNSWIVCDEAQNMTINQMLMILTRIGENSKLVITGDPAQYDRGYNNNGLSDLIQRITYNNAHNSSDMDDNENIQIIHFDENDVERHPVIPYILHLYK